jgi:hypothetical protein
MVCRIVGTRAGCKWWRSGNLQKMVSQGAPVELRDRPFNNLLRCLTDSDFALLEPSLEQAIAAPNEVLYHPGDHVATVHFPCGPSLVSFLVAIEDGRDVETILVGREGAVGGIVSQGTVPAYSRIVVKFGGPFVRMTVPELKAAKSQSPSLDNLFVRYADCLLAQFCQSTACNAVHSIEQRAAKWIIAAVERTGENVVPLTHEQLATMVGVGRSYASRIIQKFKAERILETQRGAIRVRSRAALRAKSCLCNAAVKDHFANVLDGVYPGSAIVDD